MTCHAYLWKKWNRIMTFTLLFSMTALTAAARNQPLPDQEVADAIEDEILIDNAILLNNIDVSVQNGIATLSGQVDNILAKERAARIAGVVRGVKNVVNRIEVKPRHDWSDETLATNVRTELLLDPATESYEVDVNAKDGVIILNGTVDSRQERILAAKVAKGVAGVIGLDNRIDVKYDVDRPDAELKPEIRKRLKWDVLVDDAMIHIQVDDGAVSLTGVVGSAAEKQRAKINAWVAGVKSVDATGLDVERWARDEELRGDKYRQKSDEQVRQAILGAMAADPRVQSFNVQADVDDGRVTLRGKVDNLKAKRAAAGIARQTVGVDEVTNRIKVRPKETAGDEALAKKVRQAIKRNPYLEKSDITVIADNGVVDLYGQVDSFFEKGEADDIAARMQGVILVDNNLSVDNEQYVYDPYIEDWYAYDYGWYDYEPAYTLMMSDETIEDEINDELWWSPFVDSDDIHVSVAGGEAVLTGTVDSYNQRRIAAENALEGGATSVDNRLTVVP